ncbi:MAG TPA: FAD-dependent oxidoreductase, partial [bacterium]
MSTTQAADVVIIGGGIVGLSAAYFLARRGKRVVLLDKGRLAWEQSSRNWGFVRQQGRDPIELPMIALSNRIWCGISEELDADTEWRQGGNLALAATAEDLARYAQDAEEAQAAGIETRVLTRKQVQALLPLLRGSFVGGLYTASDGQADPLKGTLAFARGAEREGVELREYCAVEGIATTGGRVSGVATTQGEIRAEAVVCAAGVHSAHLARLAGLNLPQRAVRSSVAATAPVPHLTDLGVWAQGVGFRQARDGSLILGKASAGTADHDVTLETFRNVGLFLPIYLKNRDLFHLRFG